MKKYLLFSMVVLSFSCSKKLIRTTYVEKPIPEEVSRVSYYQMLGKTECTVKEWNLFLASLKRDSSAEFYKQMVPDTFIFYKDWEVPAKKSFAYFTEKQFENYPIVGIYRSQALAFCRWKTSVWEAENAKLPLEKRFKKIEFMLPERELWVAGAQSGNTNEPFYWWAAQTTKPWKRKYLICLDNSPENRKDVGTILRAGTAGKQSPYGFKNMQGNVAEMLATEGLAMGGNADIPFKQCTAVSTMQYSQPACTLGFRYAAVIVEE